MRTLDNKNDKYSWLNSLESSLEVIGGNRERLSVLDPAVAANIRVINPADTSRIDEDMFESLDDIWKENDSITDDEKKIDDMYRRAQVGNLFIIVPKDTSDNNTNEKKNEFAICQVTLDEDGKGCVVSDINQLDFEELPTPAQKFWRALRKILSIFTDIILYSKEERLQRKEDANKRDVQEKILEAMESFVEADVSTEKIDKMATDTYEEFRKNKDAKIDSLDKPIDMSEHDAFIEKKVSELSEVFELYFKAEEANAADEVKKQIKSHIKDELTKKSDGDQLIKYYNDLRAAFGRKAGIIMDKVIKDEDLENLMTEDEKKAFSEERVKNEYEMQRMGEYISEIRTQAINFTGFNSYTDGAVDFSTLKEYAKGEMSENERNSYEKGLGVKLDENKKNISKVEKAEIHKKLLNYTKYGKERKNCIELATTALEIYATGQYATECGCETGFNINAYRKITLDSVDKLEGAIKKYVEMNDKKELCEMLADSISAYGKKMIEADKASEVNRAIYCEGFQTLIEKCKDVLGDDANTVLNNVKGLPKVEAYADLVRKGVDQYSALSSIIRTSTDGETKMDVKKNIGAPITKMLFAGEMSRSILSFGGEKLDICLGDMSKSKNFVDDYLEKLKNTNTFKKVSQMTSVEILKISSTPGALNKVYMKSVSELKKMEEKKMEDRNQKSIEKVNNKIKENVIGNK